MNPGDNSPIADPSARAVVNANYNANNIFSTEEGVRQLVTTLDKCIRILKDHCGPKSGYAMLVNNLSTGAEFEPNVFTRDGIRIMSAVEFMSPLERYIKDILTYVGTRVDSNAKDGTTTSMLVSASFLKRVLSKSEVLRSLGLTFFQMNLTMDTLCKKILEYLKNYTFDLKRISGLKADEELSEDAACIAGGKVAFIQALSSSGGNVELAYAMKAIFERSPQVTWDTVSYIGSKKENGRSFQLDIANYDARIPCTIETEGVMNRALGSEYYAENVTCLVTVEPINDLSFQTEAIRDFIEKFDPNQPLLVVSPFVGGSFTSFIFELNKRRTAPVVVALFASRYKINNQSFNWDLISLLAVSGASPYDMSKQVNIDERNVFVAKSVHWHGALLDFDGIVELESGSCLHPFYAHPERATPYYTAVLEEVKAQLQMYKEGHKPDEVMEGVFTEVLNSLTAIRRPKLRLGGTAHEQIANKDVAQDVEGAILSSLKHGFLINGPISLSFALYQAKEYFSSKLKTDDDIVTRNMDRFAVEIAESLWKAITEDVIATIYNLDPDTDQSNWRILLSQLEDDPNDYINSLTCDPQKTTEPYRLYDFISLISSIADDVKNTDVDSLKIGSTYPVFQPIMITTELLKRMQELLIKFLNTNKFIVYGGVVVSDDKKE